MVPSQLNNFMLFFSKVDINVLTSKPFETKRGCPGIMGKEKGEKRKEKKKGERRKEKTKGTGIMIFLLGTINSCGLRHL